jgi:hypothetical protein
VPGGSQFATARISRRRHLHAADVREHRRLGRRAVADRFARARRIVRAGRRPRARQRRAHRSAASSSRSARMPVIIEDEALDRRQHRHLRGRDHQGARGDRAGPC